MNHKTSRIEIARALYDWTVSSKNRFIDNNDELVKKAEKWGMKFPNPDLALMETIYCELDVYNRNGAMLPRTVAEAGIDTIIGKQINFEHEGAGHVCGYIIDAYIKDNFIIIDSVLFKSVWREEFEQVKKSFEDGKLFVSFELWNSENGISILKILSDGKKIVEKLIAHGCGLLMKEKPACPKAKVFKLLASEELVLASEKIDKTELNTDDKLSYAELSIKEECKNCGNCPNERRQSSMTEEIAINEFEDTELVELAEEIQLTDEDILASDTEEELAEEGETLEAKKLSYQNKKNLKDSDFAVVIKKGDKKIRKYPIHDAAHVRNALARLGQAAAKEGLKKLGVSVESVLKKVKSRAKKFGIETASEEVILPTPVLCENCGQALGEGQEGKLCPACIIFEQEFAKFSEVLEEAAVPADVLKRIKELHKEGKSMKESMKTAWSEHKTKAAEVEKAHLDTMKHCSGCGEVLPDGSEGELCAMCNLKHEKAHLQETNDQLMKESEAHKISYADLQKKHEESLKACDEKCAEHQKQYQELKDKHDALMKEHENLKQELGKKDQEVAELKIVKAKAEVSEAKISLTVGSVESTSDDYLKEIRNKVDQKAFGANSLGAK